MRITENVELARLIVRAHERGKDAGEVEELVRGADRERTEQQGVDQRNAAVHEPIARASETMAAMLARRYSQEHARAEAEIAGQGFEPRGGFDFVAGFTRREAVAELAAGDLPASFCGVPAFTSSAMRWSR